MGLFLGGLPRLTEDCICTGSGLIVTRGGPPWAALCLARLTDPPGDLLGPVRPDSMSVVLVVMTDSGGGEAVSTALLVPNIAMWT